MPLVILLKRRQDKSRYLFCLASWQHEKQSQIALLWAFWEKRCDAAAKGNGRYDDWPLCPTWAKRNRDYIVVMSDPHPAQILHSSRFILPIVYLCNQSTCAKSIVGTISLQVAHIAMWPLIVAYRADGQHGDTHHLNHCAAFRRQRTLNMVST